MHIPDGYLSPSTCGTLYLLASGGWWEALHRLKRSLGTRVIPLISVFAAFSFVVMIFNVPLPGGTTGHALGVAVAAIVLGPWGSMLAISIAIAIQALFFGDGGITTLGANCFNMAIVGSLVAYGTFRLVAVGAGTKSRRRVVAAAIAGYVAINASALLAAVEFGIQPLLFHDASGTPLYAPYPIRIAIPAMMIGHLTFAGLAEAIISAGMVAYLQRTDLGLLRGLGGQSGNQMQIAPPIAQPSSQKPLWWAVGLLMLATPLGILAAGTAWGEWSAQDLANPQVRAEIERTAGNKALPFSVPRGLQSLSQWWTAPFPGYAPKFIKSPTVGYLLSAMFGVGFLVLVSLLTFAATKKRRRRELAS
jgi:cobalt/nickel transport system permease protein